MWLRNKTEHMENNDYVWKVLLPETLIKFYMDYFKLTKKEAEKRIAETPLRCIFKFCPQLKIALYPFCSSDSELMHF